MIRLKNKFKFKIKYNDYRKKYNKNEKLYNLKYKIKKYHKIIIWINQYFQKILIIIKIIKFKYILVIMNFLILILIYKDNNNSF